jgi:multidrug efflux pump
VNLPAFCIHRPAFTIVISLIMVIIGLIGFINLPVRWIPNVNLPQVSISTAYPGANARLVEHDITKVLEDALSGISGMDTLTSTSKRGQSQISITFKPGYKVDTALEDVRGGVERVRNILPKNADNPVVGKADPNGQPVLFLSFFDSHRNQRELSDYIDKYLVPSFETIDGVGSVLTFGKRISGMHIRLDPAKMAGAKVTVDEVSQLLQDQNASLPGGQIRGFDRFYSVVTDTTINTPEEFNDLIIRDDQNQIVRLKDIGDAKIEAENEDSAFRINGKPGIALGIVPQSTANPLDVEKQVQSVIADIKRTLPSSMQVRIDYNQADYIRTSMRSVYESFIEAVIFVWLVILLFLGNFRATFVPIITIPVCIISTFALLYFLGFSINTITLMAFVLAIGLVVDDAIVMLENINRHIENGLTPFKAALRGSREIVFPIIAMTLTLAAVYTPIAFTPGLLGILFREFTFTLAGAVIVSGIVALTLSPMMCARLLKASSQSTTSTGILSAFTKHCHEWLARQLSRFQIKYQKLLQLLLQKRIWVVAFLVIVGGLGFGILKFLPSELAPAEDMNEIDVFAAAPRSASFEYTDSYVKQLEGIYKRIPDIESYLVMVGMSSPSRSWPILTLKSKSKREHDMNEIVRDVTAQASQITGIRPNVSVPPPALAEFAGGDEGDKLGLVIMTSGDYLKLQQVVAKIMEELKNIPGFVHVENKLKWDSEQFQINIDREKAADLRVPVPNITNTISTLLAGRKVGKTNEDLDITVQINKAAQKDPDIFRQLYVRNVGGDMVPLANMVSIKETSSPEFFHHYNRFRSDTIFANLSPDFKLADAINVLQTLAKTNIPDDMKFTFSGEAKSFLESNGKTVFTFLLALIFIYLVLVAQFESFIDPLIIMLTVPFAIVGAMLTLKIFGGSLNIYSNIGLITLIGLIAKHGILITEFANRLRASGQSIEQAVISASLLRLRPILMTTATMILGAMPLAFAFGPGAESRQQIGLVITGGLFFGTLFSLIVVPITYTYLAPFRKVATISTDQEEEYATVL